MTRYYQPAFPVIPLTVLTLLFDDLTRISTWVDSLDVLDRFWEHIFWKYDPFYDNCNIPNPLLDMLNRQGSEYTSYSVYRILKWICFPNHWRDKLPWMHVPRFPFCHLNKFLEHINGVVNEFLLNFIIIPLQDKCFKCN